jgi:hypothetical protein
MRSVEGLDLAALLETDARTIAFNDIATGCISRLSSADHSSVPETGSLKTASSVLRCLLFMPAA